jgi:hypothetical protein
MDGVLKFFGVMTAIASAGAVGYLLIAVANVLARRLEGGRSTELAQLESEMADLRARLDDADAARHRIAELEERLDFAERMLTQQRDAQRIGPGER